MFLFAYIINNFATEPVKQRLQNLKPTFIKTDTHPLNNCVTRYKS